MLINLLPLVSVMTLLDPVRKAAISIFLFRVTVVYTTMLPLTLSYRRLHDSWYIYWVPARKPCQRTSKLAWITEIRHNPQSVRIMRHSFLPCLVLLLAFSEGPSLFSTTSTWVQACFFCFQNSMSCSVVPCARKSVTFRRWTKPTLISSISVFRFERFEYFAKIEKYFE